MTRLRAAWIVLTDGRMAFNVVEDVRLRRLLPRRYGYLSFIEALLQEQEKKRDR
jgi:hypothetical protein